MFTDKFLKQALELSKARFKHSNITEDIEKYIEEVNEFEQQLYIPVEETQAMEEFNDLVISAFGCLVQKLEPETIEELENINQFLSDENEFKTERTLKRFESGFYK